MTRRNKDTHGGAASAAPPLVETLDEAETLLTRVSTPEEAERLVVLGEQRGQEWRAFKLRAERRWGELLGEVEEQGHTGRGHSVTTGHAISDAERAARKKARKVAAVPEEKFERYLRESDSPTREGLLRVAGAKRKPKPRRQGEETIAAREREMLPYRTDVLNWVRKLTRAGKSRSDLVDLSREGDAGWPAPGKALSNGAVSLCRCVIHHLEDQGVPWPLRPGGALSARTERRRLNKRQQVIARARVAARRNGDPHVLWDTAFEVSKLTSLLYSLDVQDAQLDEHGLEIMETLHEDMLYLQEWNERMLFAVQARLGELPLRHTIKSLRAKTVANGCSVEEAETAARMADRLQRRLEAVIAA